MNALWQSAKRSIPVALKEYWFSLENGDVFLGHYNATSSTVYVEDSDDFIMYDDIVAFCEIVKPDPPKIEPFE